MGTTTSDGGSDTILKTSSSGKVNNATGLTQGSGNQLTVTSQSATDIPEITKGAASQSGNLKEWRDSGNNVLAYVKADGSIGVGTVAQDARIRVVGTNQLRIGGTGDPTSFGIDGNGGSTNLGNGFQIGWNNNASSFGAGNDTGIGRMSAGVIKVTDGSTGIKALMGGGASVASATALPLPTGRVFHVTGTTTITSITTTNLQAGVVITLIFDGALTFTDGNNLKLAGNFVTTADDTITLAYDGTNFYEIARSVN
jgi:hypothetical protein